MTWGQVKHCSYRLIKIFENPVANLCPNFLIYVVLRYSNGCYPRMEATPPVWSNYNGGVPERLNGTVSKTVVPVRAPWVRIPPPPPFAAQMMGKVI